MLSIIATPIGNLGDITLRSIETLKKCDAIVCEDTRITGMLLKHLEIEKKECISCHGYSNPKKIEGIIERLQKGEHLCLVSDAGTPGISDPGYAVVSAVREYNKGINESHESQSPIPNPQSPICNPQSPISNPQSPISIEALPGPSAFLTALSASGLPINQFIYMGFLPIKKGRQTLLLTFPKEKRTIVFYESVHRIERTLHELNKYLEEQPNRTVVIGRELTKMHEEIISTTVCKLPEIATSITKKGEFVVVIGAT